MDSTLPDTKCPAIREKSRTGCTGTEASFLNFPYRGDTFSFGKRTNGLPFLHVATITGR